MLRYLFLVTLVCCACKNNDDKDLQKKIHLYLNQRNYEALDNTALKQLALYNSEDSVAAYITLCALVIDSFTSWKNYNAATKFAMLASSKEGSVQKDSLLKTKLGEIDYNAARNIFDFTYNDTCLYLFETAIRNTSSIPVKSNIAQALGIMYNILGDRSKAALYFHSCYQARLQMQQSQPSVSLEKRNKSLAGAIINKLIFFNGYSRYDSTIHYAKIGLALDSLEPKKMAYLKAFLAEAIFNIGPRTDALPLLDESLHLLSKENQEDEDVQDRIRDVLRVKAALLAEQNEFKKSNECLYTASHVMQHRFTNRYNGKVLVGIASNFLKTAVTDSAIYYAHKALSTVTNIDTSDLLSLPVAHGLYVENTIKESTDILAEAFTKKYDQTNDEHFAAAAIACYDIAFTVENKLLSYYEYDESKLALMADSRNRSEKAITLCYRLLQKTRDQQWAQKAFVFGERNKSVVLLQSLKKNIAANELLQHDTLYQRMQNLRLQAAFTEKLIAQTTPVNGAAAKNAEQKAAAINADIISLSALLAKNNPGYRESILKKDSLDLSIINQQLVKNDSSAILEFFSGEHSMYAFIYSGNNPVQLIRYDSSLLPHIRRYLSFFTGEDSIVANPKAYEEAAFVLYDRLGFKTVMQQYHRLIIIPDGIFSFIPFESLLYHSVASLSLKNLPYLLNVCNISYGFSAATLLKQTGQKNNQGNVMLAMAPLFTENSRGFAPIPGTGKELEIIQPVLPRGNYLSGKQATLKTYRQYSQNAAYIHLATHAMAGETGNDPEIEFSDSALSLKEIYAMPLHADLAVLSACNTGIGKVEKGEGFMSLARGFYYAGVPHIITSLWQVNDASTGNLFKSFYTSMQKQGYENAFYEAKKTYLQSDLANEKYSPYYWAGLIFIGDNNPPASSNTLLYIITAVLLTAIVFYILIRRK